MDLQNIADKKLAIVGGTSFVIAIFFLAPRSISIFCTLFVAAIIGALVFLKSRWVEAEAD
jgi:hypothetical protein